jgi:triosephosphate isomerase
MKNKWIGTGWKMNHLMSDAMQYSDQLREFCLTQKPSSNIFICVPFTVLYAVAQKLKDTPVRVASQNVHWLERGAATGEISPLMVKDTGASMIEIGHSERRSMFAETDLTVNAKVIATLKNGLDALVCIGETAQDKELGVTFERLANQIKIAFHEVGPEHASHILVAYEPVWAIGESGSPAAPEYADEIHEKIHGVLREVFGEQAGGSIPVIYGGSVNPQNALPLINKPSIDGLFIGRSAWSADGFTHIISMVENSLTQEQVPLHLPG